MGFGLVIAIAFLIKAVVLAQLHDHPLLQPQGELDTTTYVELARRVAEGGPLAVREPFFVSPLYVFFLAAIFKAGGSLLAARVVQILLGAVGVGLIWALARFWFGERAAWLAAALALLTGLFTFYEILILQSALDPFLTAGALWLVSRAYAGGGTRLHAAAGICLGLFTLNRPNALIYTLVAGTFVAIRAVRNYRGRGNAATRGRDPSISLSAGSSIAAFVIGLLLVIGANALRNYIVSGEAILVSSHGGLNFYIGNHAGARGIYDRIPGITPSIVGQMRDSTRVAETDVGRQLTPSEVSDYFYRLARRWMAEHPRDALALFVRKLALVINSVNVPLNYSYAYYSRDENTLLRFLVIGPWLLVPLGVIGLLLPGARVRHGGFWVFASFVPVYAVAVAIFFVSSRYRLPLLVPLCPLAAATLAWLGDRIRARDARHLVPAALGIFAVAALAQWDLQLDDGRTGEQTRKAVWLIEQGAHEDARRYMASIAADPGYPAALQFKVGEAFATAGKYDDAIAHYQEALRAGGPDSNAAQTQLALGQALVVLNRSREAIAPLEIAVGQKFRPDVSSVWLVRALVLAGEPQRARDRLSALSDDLSASRYETGYELGELALEIGDAVQARRWLTSAVRLKPDRADAQEKLGVASLLLGKPADALPAFEAACRLDPVSASAHLNLAVAYAQLGRTNEARAAAERALQLDPAEPRTRALLDKLQRR
ncbi:MAG TPA: tetratricopeptide repeat protein [Vicinamibacterales bacterium]|nr:tetratricopeptide repeat protein [Vicinamibacterales bacterium]